MKLIELDKQTFTSFSLDHELGSFYQTVSYAEVMRAQGMSAVYLGMISDSNKLKAASLFLIQEKNGVFGKKIKFAYCPRGFLIDYNDLELLKLFSSEVKKYMKKLKVMYVRIDPLIENVKRFPNGEIDYNGFNNYHVVENLSRSGFKHLGFNKYFESLKPRWNVIIQTDDSKELYNNFSKDIKSKIRKAQNMGVSIVKGTSSDLDIFYQFVAKKHIRSLKYYTDFYNIFKETDMCELYLAHLNPQTFLEKSRKLYDEEVIRNNSIVEQVQNSKRGSMESLVNKKMISDAAIAQYKDNIVTSTKLLGLYPEGVTLSAAFIIKYKNEVFFLIDGFNKKSEIITSTNLLRYSIMEYYINNGYKVINMNGITGNFNPKNKYYGLYKTKISYGGNVVEYIGEFDLVIKKSLYNLYRYIKPLQSYLKKDMRE